MQQNVGNLLVLSRFYESAQTYEPDQKDFANLVRFSLTEDWSFRSKGIWSYCTAKDYDIPSQGWKLHLSATAYDSRSVLTAALPVLSELRASFKFPKDKRVLSLMGSKQWSRGNSGKFITVYPADDEHFLSLAEALHLATRQMVGPYILTDRRYKKDHSVVYYRYGTMNPDEEVSLSGALTSYLHGPHGEKKQDDRRPIFQVPEWVTDPFEAPPPDQTGQTALKDGRYLVERVLSYSNTGGVYLATDQLRNCAVVIKEARAYVGGASMDSDAAANLRKEYRILKKLADTGVTPKPIDFFNDWENLYLVEEFIDGTLLSDFAANEGILLRAPVSTRDRELYRMHFSGVFRAIAIGLKVIHSLGIALFDLSPANIIVTDDAASVVFIDFEAACDCDIDTPTSLATPGFTPRCVGPFDESAKFANDYYALAATMLAFVLPVNELLQAYPEKIEPVVESICIDVDLPRVVVDSVLNGLLMKAEPGYLDAVAKSLQSLDIQACDKTGVPPTRGFSRVSDKLHRIQSFILNNDGNCGYDRLFPCHNQAYLTNPLSLGYAAYGTIFALYR